MYEDRGKLAEKFVSYMQPDPVSKGEVKRNLQNFAIQPDQYNMPCGNVTNRALP